MVLNGLFCADVPLRNYSLTHWLTHSCCRACCKTWRATSPQQMEAVELSLRDQSLITCGSGSGGLVRTDTACPKLMSGRRPSSSSSRGPGPFILLLLHTRNHLIQYWTLCVHHGSTIHQSSRRRRTAHVVDGVIRKIHHFAITCKSTTGFHWLAGVMVSMLQSKAREFDSGPGRHQVVTTWVGDRSGKPSLITNLQRQLSLPSFRIVH